MNLWKLNTPQSFWRILQPFSEQDWDKAVCASYPILGLSSPYTNLDNLLEATLGEGQFGAKHWELSLPKRAYYELKPFIPRWLTRWMRQLYGKSKESSFLLKFPIEVRFSRFLWSVAKELLLLNGLDQVPHIGFWKHGAQAALVLTHDIENAGGQAYVMKVAEMEADLGYRSSFNFVPERYPLDLNLMQRLRDWGFEIGIHGLKHDGRLFLSKKVFDSRVIKINQYLKEFQAIGFRTPLTHRQPYWMQTLDIQYDLSFFDTDPFEPIAGGTMSMHPFILGKFVELPYTLPQDYTVAAMLEETSADLWLEKAEKIAQFQGLVLLNTHPDYLLDSTNWVMYHSFLSEMQKKPDYWRALPREVAGWWRRRMQVLDPQELDGGVINHIRLTDILSTLGHDE